jgi:hypothetical protein
MRLGIIQGAQDLAQIQPFLVMGDTEDADDAIRNIVAFLRSSRNGELRQTIQNSLFFKL